MTTYLVSYDLRKPGRNYDDVYEYLKGLGGWALVLESLWAITTTKSAREVADGLLALVDKGDGVFVIKSSGVASWDNVICADNWLQTNL